MKNVKPIDYMGMYELLVAAYPEKFKEGDECIWNEVIEFADSISGFNGIADLIGRVVMLTMPMTSPISGDSFHCLGVVAHKGGNAHITPIIKRKVMSTDNEIENQQQTIDIK